MQMREAREQRETGRRRRDARRKKREVSLFAVFVSTMSSRALNSHLHILYLMYNVVSTCSAALRCMVMEIKNA
jgi:3-oxoacyl-(acyl-carrier-protein) synthase